MQIKVLQVYSKIRLLDSNAPLIYFFQNMPISLQNWQHVVREQSRRAVESLETFLPLHSELLPVESCDICVIEIPHSCVQITH